MTEPAVDFRAMRVLVIDDEDFIRRLIARVLYQLGIKQVVEARDGAEALVLIKQPKTIVDVIICDLEMPKMDGIEFVRQLRSDENVTVSRTPILILTGHSVEKNIEEVVELGIHGFLAKPVSTGVLEERLISAMSSPPIDPKVLNRE